MINPFEIRCAPSTEGFYLKSPRCSSPLQPGLFTLKRSGLLALVVLMLLMGFQLHGAGTNSAQAEIAPKVAAARAILDPWLAHNPEPARKKVHLVLWTPKDREPAPRYQERLSAIFQDIRSYYAREMERIGFGPRTIGLDEDANGLVRVHLVRGLKDYTHYAVASGSAIRKECLPTLEAAGLKPEEELIVIFCNMSNWDDVNRTISQNSPYYASGTHRGGTAWQVDSPILDLAFLGEKGENVRDGQYGNISLGRYNSIFIGGACHELGHALGLRHNKERAEERAAFGTALMGSGNRTYGEQLRGESKGSFLTLAHALRLAAHPMFSGSAKDIDKPRSAKHEALKIEAKDKGFTFSGRVTTPSNEPPVYAVIAYMDPTGGSDYDATTATAVPDAEGKFTLDCQALAPGKTGELRVVYLQANGQASGFLSSTPYRYPYVVAKDGDVDLAPALAVLNRAPRSAPNQPGAAAAGTNVPPAVTAQLRIPAFTAYTDPDANGARISQNSGVTGWRDPKLTVSWFGDIKAATAIDAAVELRVPANAASKLRLTVAGQSHDTEVKGDGTNVVVARFGRFSIKEAGYQRFALESLNDVGQPFGDIEALVLDGLTPTNAHFNLKSRRNAASVHLTYANPKGTNVAAFYCEMTGIEEPVATYYMACGWHRGYFGMQVNSKIERRIIFSVWDSGGEAVSRSKVADTNRVLLMGKGEGVNSGDFGNEGTGGHSHLKYNWKTGEKQRFIVTAQPTNETFTIFSGYWFHPETKEWMLISSWRAPKDGSWLRGLYSFSENFGGNNGHLARKALYGNQWLRTDTGEWIEMATAGFSHDSTGKADRLDRFMGVENGQFFLHHGGFVNGFTKYGEKFTRPAGGQSPSDIKLPVWVVK